MIVRRTVYSVQCTAYNVKGGGRENSDGYINNAVIKYIFPTRLLCCGTKMQQWHSRGSLTVKQLLYRNSYQEKT